MDCRGGAAETRGRSIFKKGGNTFETDFRWISGFKDTAIKRGEFYKPQTPPQIKEQFFMHA